MSNIVFGQSSALISGSFFNQTSLVVSKPILTFDKILTDLKKKINKSGNSRLGLVDSFYYCYTQLALALLDI